MSLTQSVRVPIQGEVKVRDGSVTAVLLAGGVGKRMGVCHLGLLAGTSYGGESTPVRFLIWLP
jgi:hypothetical protein